MSRLQHNPRPGPAPTEDEWERYRRLRDAKEARRVELAKAAGDQGNPGGNTLSRPFGKLSKPYGYAKKERQARQRD